MKVKETELIVSPVPSGHSLGGTAWKIEFNKLQIFYAMDLCDKVQQVTPPLQMEKFRNANILITNGYLNYNSEGRHHQFVSEERLK